MAGRQLLAHLLRLAKILRAPPDILFISVAGQICALSSQAWAQFDWLGGATRGSRAGPRPKRHLSTPKLTCTHPRVPCTCNLISLRQQAAGGWRAAVVATSSFRTGRSANIQRT